MSSIAFSETPSFTQIDIVREFDALKNTHDPEPEASISYLFVLSGANSYLRKVEHLKLADLDDDFNRMEHAIETARKITALRACVELSDLNQDLVQTFGPTIVYNGGMSQNNDLSLALEMGLPNYPKEKFKILDLSPTEINTKGQFQSIKGALPIEKIAVGIVTHAYHFPRVSRMLGDDAPLYPFGPDVKKFAFLTDREFTSPGIEECVRKEIEKIPLYIKNGDLAQNPAPDIIYQSTGNFL